MCPQTPGRPTPAFAEIGFSQTVGPRIALQACLVTEQTDKTAFDDLFDEFWRRLTAGPDRWFAFTEPSGFTEIVRQFR